MLGLSWTTLSQERLVWKDFNIEDEVGSAEKPLVKQVLNVNVTNNMLEIRFYFAGKGTTRIPDRGVYGPIISAISVFSGKLYVWHLFSIIQLSTMHVHMIDLKPVPLC
jgi:hypothetical protein